MKQSSKRTKSFFVLVRDHDRKVFSVHGPVTELEMFTTLVHQAQAAGRTIDHSNAGTSGIESITKKASRDSGYAEVSSALTV